MLDLSIKIYDLPDPPFEGSAVVWRASLRAPPQKSYVCLRNVGRCSDPSHSFVELTESVLSLESNPQSPLPPVRNTRDAWILPALPDVSLPVGEDLPNSS